MLEAVAFIILVATVASSSNSNYINSSYLALEVVVSALSTAVAVVITAVSTAVAVVTAAILLAKPKQ